jgi:uncharacterized protein
MKDSHMIMGKKFSKNSNKYHLALAEMETESPNLAHVAGLLQEALVEQDFRAAWALGTWHLHGKYFAKDARKAVPLLKQAAEAGVPEALYELAVCYEAGEGVRKNPSAAAGLFLQAALLGSAVSAHEIGRCYYYGVGVMEDKRVARIWLDLAAEIGYKA